MARPSINHAVAALRSTLAQTKAEIRECVSKGDQLDRESKANGDKLRTLHEKEWDLQKALTDHGE